jgi:hypothetical protein
VIGAHALLPEDLDGRVAQFVFKDVPLAGNAEVLARFKKNSTLGAGGPAKAIGFCWVRGLIRVGSFDGARYFHLGGGGQRKQGEGQQPEDLGGSVHDGLQ